MRKAPESQAEKSALQQSRVGKKSVGGYFDPGVIIALKKLAAEKETTIQNLLAEALNDILDRNGYGRPADESETPRGGAAHRR